MMGIYQVKAAGEEQEHAWKNAKLRSDLHTLNFYSFEIKF